MMKSLLLPSSSVYSPISMISSNGTSIMQASSVPLPRPISLRKSFAYYCTPAPTFSYRWCKNNNNSNYKNKRIAVNCSRNSKEKRNLVSTSEDASSCLITPPPRGIKPRAIVKLLGGAFIGAIPQLTYGYLTELLAKDGYLVISVPYNVTFDHAQAATEIFQRFNVCLDSILASGLPDFSLTPADLVHLPLYSVGHSNGALLQVLAGSYFQEKIPKANVIISFNNRPATEAVPYFEQLGPFVSDMAPMAEASPVYPMIKSASDDAWKALREVAASVVNYDKEALKILERFVNQLPSVLDQIAQGTSEFKPAPLENRQLVEQSYNVHHTLLVKFNVDAIDETDLLEAALRPRIESIGGRLEKITLNGTHITPCLQGPVWPVGNMYTPADAIFQGFKAALLNDTKILSKTICQWLEQVDIN
ncbi:hypothetical protein V2J09_018535 [Rumex salicifolius]